MYVKPQLATDWIEWQNDHDLWLRDPDIPGGEPDDGDVPIVPPHWTPTNTKPFAYTISTTMTSNVHLVTPDQSVTGQVCIRYLVVNSWSDGFEDIPRTKDKIASLPTELAHQPPARPRVRPPYTLTQNYAFYVKRHQDSDWACAGTRTAVHPQVFLTFGQPVGPWGQTQGGTIRTCWSAVLNTACTWMPAEGYNSGQARDAMKRLAYKAYYSGYKDYSGNISHYHPIPNANNPCTATGRRFDLWELMGASEVDCQDMSLWWQKLCHSIGLDVRARRIDGRSDGPTAPQCENGEVPWPNSGFLTRYIHPIDRANAANWGTTLWAFHHAGWDNAVFDPCVRITTANPYTVPPEPPEGQGTWVRVPQDEALSTYERDLYYTGRWYECTPWRLGQPDPFWWNLATGVD